MRHVTMHKAAGDHNKPVTIVIEPVWPRNSSEGDIEVRDAGMLVEGDQLFDILITTLPSLSFQKLAMRFKDYINENGW